MGEKVLSRATYSKKWDAAVKSRPSSALARALASLGYLRNPLVLSMRSAGKFGQRVSRYAGFIRSHLSLFYTPYYTV